MRQDMNRLLVTGGRPGHSAAFSGRVVKMLTSEDPMEVGRAPIRPSQDGWDRYGASAHFRPAVLKRFLAARTGQPWAAVYAEASSQYVPAMSRTVREWLDEYVSQNVFRNANNELVFGSKYAGVQSVTYNEYYVDPDSGLLCASQRSRYGRIDRKARTAAHAAERLKDRRIASDTLQYHRREGAWYEVTMRRVESFVKSTPFSRPWDSWQKCSAEASYFTELQYGGPHLYAHSHRALSHKELQQLNLL